jgi:hypothetical protein
MITLDQDDSKAKKRLALQLLESFSSGLQVIPTGKFCWEADFDQLLLPVLKCVKDEDVCWPQGRASHSDPIPAHL